MRPWAALAHAHLGNFKHPVLLCEHLRLTIGTQSDPHIQIPSRLRMSHPSNSGLMAMQDEIHRQHPGTTALWTMCGMNLWCTVYYGLYLFLLDASGMDLVHFCRRYPDAGLDVLLFCLCGAVGQLFIFFTIRTFGSLVNTVVCTTRKFFNILLSVLWNGNSLLPQQWLAVALVFLGLAINTLTKSSRKRPTAKRKE